MRKNVNFDLKEMNIVIIEKIANKNEKIRKCHRMKLATELSTEHASL